MSNLKKRIWVDEQTANKLKADAARAGMLLKDYTRSLVSNHSLKKENDKKKFFPFP